MYCPPKSHTSQPKKHIGFIFVPNAKVSTDQCIKFLPNFSLGKTTLNKAYKKYQQLEFLELQVFATINM